MSGSAADDPASCGQDDVSLRQGVHCCPIPIFVIDRRHRITQWNLALERFSGLAAASMSGTQRQWEAFYPVPRPVLADLIVDGASPEAVRNYYGDKVAPSPLIDGAYAGEDCFHDAAGRSRWLAFTAAPVCSPDGRLIGAVETLQDITERKAAEAREAAITAHLEVLVGERTAELQAANTELGEYGYVVSHDLRAPLRAIRNYVDFLCEDLAAHLGEPQRVLLDGLYKALREGDTLVSDLLDYARVGKDRVDHVPIRLADLFADLLPALALPATVDLRLAADLPVVRGDRLLLWQIFQNLIGNGVKFNDAAPPRIEIDWRRIAADRVEISVADNGIGIAAEHREQIFRVFQRLHTRSAYEGAGIGLAVARKAAQKQGGDLRVESEPGAGSTFFVALTCDAEEM